VLDDPDAAGWMAVSGLVVALVALAVALGAQARLTRVRRALVVLRGAGADGDILDLVTRQTVELTEQRRHLEALRERLDETRQDVAASLRHVAVVTHHGDEAAASFSAAVLDDGGNGLVLTCAGPPVPGVEPGTTVKAVVDGGSRPSLSALEAQAVLAASGRDGRGRQRGRA
jgi:Protein of unknown function (DUF4446)